MSFKLKLTLILITLFSGLSIASFASAAFPTIAATNSNNTAASLSHTVNLPTGIVAGDLLVVSFSTDGAPTATFPAGWSSLFSTPNGTANRLSVAYKIADGTEGSSITVALGGSTSEPSAYTCYRITGHYAGIGPAYGTPATGSSVNPDPPSLTASWGAADTLWLAVYGWDYNRAHSAYPANYTLSQLYQRYNATSGCGIASAGYNYNTTDTQNPGTGTIGVADTWVANTLAVRPFVASTITLGSGTDPSTTTVAPGSGIVDAGSFTLQSSANPDYVTAMTVTLAGSGTSYNGISEVRITSNDGSVTYFSAVSNPASNTVNFSGGRGIPITSSSTQFKIRVTPKTHVGMDAPNGASYALSPYVSDWTLSYADTEAGSDSNANTLTIDNASPNGATSTSGTGGTGNVALNWTTSSSTDFSRSVVLRWASSTPGSEVPAEGTDYTAGNTISTATVACVRTADSASTAITDAVDGSGGGGGCLTTTLAAGSYSYKVFQKDSNGNYDTGVTFTGSPFTVTSGTVTQIYRSVGPGATAALATDSTHANTVTLSSGVATFSAALADNIGVGDVVIIDTNNDEAITSADTLLFISKRNSSTGYQLQTHTGATPSDITINDTYQIYRAHTSLANAEAGTPNTSIPITFNGGNRDLVANGEQWNIACYANGTTADTTAVTVDGWTTDSDNFIKIYTPTLSTEVGVSQRHSGKWDDGKYQLVADAENSMLIYENYVRIEGLQISRGDYYGYYGGIIHVADVSGDIRISQNIVQGDGPADSDDWGIYNYNCQTAINIWNNIFYDLNIGVNLNSFAQEDITYVFNNTFQNCGTGLKTGYGTFIAKNNLFSACTLGAYADGVGHFGFGTDYNATNNSSMGYVVDGGGNDHDKVSQTFYFVDAINKDFHLAQSDTAARGAGANLTADANLPFSTDIDGQLRNPSGAGWDIGADEGTVEFVSTVMQSGGNFSTLSSWEDAIDSDLVADTTRVFSHGGITGTIVGGNTVTGLTSGATATVVYATATQILLHTVSGIFQSGETVQVSSGNSVVISDNGNPASAVAKIDGAWSVADTVRTIVDGWTTGHDNYIKIYTTPTARHSGKWDEWRYRLEVTATGSYESCIAQREGFMRYEGLQLKFKNNDYTGGRGGIDIADYHVHSDFTIVKDNIFVSDFNTTDGDGSINALTLYDTSYTDKYHVLNNIFYHLGSGWSGADPIAINVFGNNNLVSNNTIYYPRGIYAYGTSIVTNNIVQNSAVGYNGSFDASSGYNISNLNDAPGSSPKNSTTVSFISTTSGAEDFHLAQSDTAAKNSGTDLSTYFSTDIDGATRNASINAWDIGADETATQIFRSVGPSATGLLDSDNSHADELLSITSGVATFEVALPDNIGVGDVLIYDSDASDSITSADTLLFIHGRTDSTHYTVRTQTGAVPANVAATNDTWQIYRAHTSLSNAEAGTINSTLSTMGFAQFNGGNRDLMTNNEEWNIACYANGTTSDSNGNLISGWNTGVQNFIKVYTPVNSSEVGVSQRHKGKWDESKWYIKKTDDWGSLLSIDEDNVILDGLQIGTSASQHASIGIGYNDAVGETGNIIITNCVLFRMIPYADIRAGIDIEYENSGYHKVIIGNCMIEGFHHGFDMNINGNTQKIYIHNNTVANASYFIYRGTSINIRNNLMTNVGYFMNDGAPSASNVSHLVTDGTVSFDTTGFTAIYENQSINFIDSVNHDFHLSQIDTSAKDKGTDLSTYFTTDIDGATRTSVTAWDIGADETATQIYRSVGPSATGALATDSSHANTITLASGVATFSAALADNIGVGDAVIIDTGGTDQAIDASDTLLFIKARNSATSYQLQANDGSVPGDIAINDTYSIYRAYTSLFNAEAGTKNTSIPITFNGGNRDLVTNNEEWNIACYANGTTADTAEVTIDGWDTAQQTYLKVYTPVNTSEAGVSQRHSGKWDEGKYRLESNSVNVLNIMEDSIRIEGLQLFQNDSNNGYRRVIDSSRWNGTSWDSFNFDFYISNNIIRNTANTIHNERTGILVGSGNPGAKVRIFNNIIYDGSRNSASSTDAGIYTEDLDVTVYAYNNTISNFTRGFQINGGSGKIIAKNNIVQDCDDGFASGGYDASSDYNISDIANDAPSPSYRTNLATDVAFVNEAGKDFHLAQTDTAARGAGANLTADTYLPFSTDIDGQLRNPSGAGWDIGADEGTVEFVSTVMQSGGNFSTLSSWEDAIDSDLVADTTRVFSHGGITGTIVGGNTVTGLTSGATATVVYATSTQILLHTVSGIFQTGETLEVTAGNSVVISDNGNPASAVAKIDGTWSGVDSTGFDIDGWITGHDNYVRVYTTPTARHSGKWDTTKYRLEGDVGVYVYENYVKIDGLQIHAMYYVGNGWAIGLAGVTGVSVSNNILRFTDTGNPSWDPAPYGILLTGYSYDCDIYNNIIYDFIDETGVEGLGIGLDIAEFNNVYNNTVINSYVGIAHPYAYFDNFKNNISYGNVDNYSGDFGTGDNSNNLSGPSQNDAPGLNPINNAGVVFSDYANDDFHLAQSDTAAKDAGTDLSTYFSTDIDGATRKSVAQQSGSDDFTTDPSSRWTNLRDSMTWSSGAYSSDSSQDYAVYNIPTITNAQYVKVNAYESNSLGAKGIVMRSTGTASDGYYVIVTGQGDYNAWITYADETGWVEDMASASFPHDFSTSSPGDSFGFTIEGSGTGTVARIWINPVNNSPFSSGAWDDAFDAPDTTITLAGYAGSNFSNTGKYLGLGSWDALVTYDNFYGGSIAETWDIGADETATQIFRSVGPSATGLLASDSSHANTVTLTSGVATFSVGLPDNIGVGDAVIIDTNGGTGDQSIASDDTLLFIHSRTSSTVYTLRTHTGSVPGDIAINDTWQIYRAYTSLSNAEAGTINSTLSTMGFSAFTGGDRDLLANNEEWNIACYANGTTADTVGLDIKDWYTAQQNFIRFYTPVSSSEVGSSQRHSGKWDDGKYRLQVSAGGDNAILIWNGYVKIEGLQVALSDDTNSKIIEIFGGYLNELGTGLDISSNILRGGLTVPTTPTLGIQIPSLVPAGYINIFNNIIYDIGTAVGSSGVYYRNSFVNNYVYNNTIENSNIGFYNYTGSVMFALTNNITQNCTDGYYTDWGWDPVSDYNISDLAGDAPGANSKNSTNVLFLDESGNDFHLSQSDTTAKDAGTDLSTYFSTDIDGATRNSSINNWDIGADETATRIFRSVGPSATGLLATDSSHANTVTLTSGVATFSAALADNIGVGDAVIIDTGGTDQTIDASDTLLFIKARNSATSYQLQANDGSVPGDIAINDTYSIYRAYTSLFNAEAGTKNTSIPIVFNGGNRDLVTNNEEWNIACYANGTTADTTAVTIDGWGTAQQNFIKVYTPVNTSEVGVSQRHSGKWDEGKYRIEVQDIYQQNGAIVVYNYFTRIEGLQIRNRNQDLGVSITGILVGGITYSDVRIQNNIIQSYDSSGLAGGFGVNFDYNNSLYNKSGIISNNIIYGFKVGNNSNTGGISVYYYWNDVKVYNNTVLDSQVGIAIAENQSPVINNIVQRCNDGFVGTMPAGSDYNISDLAGDAPGANSKNSTTVEFVNEAGKDFHLAQTDTAARGAGANLTAEIATSEYLLAMTRDVDGQLRNPAGAGWDIGADEGTVEFVSTVMQSGGNFSTLSSWEDAIDSDLVADTTRVFSHGGITGTIVGGNTVTGLTSGATATVVYATATQILLHTVSGIFQSGETLQVTAGNSVVISDNGNPASAVVKIDGAWTVADTTALSINGWITGADNYIRVYTTDSARHIGKWSDNKYVISAQSPVYIVPDNVTIDGLQVKSTNYNGISFNAGGDYYLENNTVSNNIVTCTLAIPTHQGIVVSNPYSAHNIKVFNNIVYNFNRGFNIGASYPSTNFIVANNTAYGNESIGIDTGGNGLLIKNNISVNNPKDYDENYKSLLYSHNISSDATAPGSSGSKINAEVKFISTEAGNEDFHLHPDDRFAIDAGTDLSTYFTNDIDGQTRLRQDSGVAQWDIGADETATRIYRSVGPGKNDTLDNDTGHTKNVTLTAGVATFSAPLPDNVGVGDVVIIDTNNDEAITSADTLLFISKRNSSTTYQLQTHTGATPSDITINDTYQIYRAHTSLANAESGTINSTLSGLGFTFNGGNRDLVANNEQWNIACYANGTTADTTVYVSDWTTGENNFIKIYTPVEYSEVGVNQRHDGKWDDNRYNLKASLTGSYQGIISVNSKHLKVDGIQIYINNIGQYTSDGGVVTSAALNSSGELTVSNSIITGTVTGTEGSMGLRIFSGVDFKAYFYNNIIYGFSYAGGRGILVFGDSNSYNYIYNNTVSDCDMVGIETQTSKTIIKNNITQNCSNGFAGTFDASSDYNISDLAADAPGTNSKNSTNVLFLDEANDDFRLSSDDTAAKGAGLNLSTDTNLSFFDDIRGQARPASPTAWSIGASEPQSAGKIKLEGTQIKMEGDAKFE